MASVPWQAVIDELRLLRSDMVQAHDDHNQRMGRHETDMQVMQTLHEQRMDAHEARMDAMQRQHDARMTQMQQMIDQGAERLVKAEDTLERITVIWNRLNNPETNGH